MSVCVQVCVGDEEDGGGRRRRRQAQTAAAEAESRRWPGLLRTDPSSLTAEIRSREIGEAAAFPLPVRRVAT